METLTDELAENIVSKIMETVNNNINVMNKKGIIIASGNKSRIGTIHEGALIAIQRKSEVNIDEKQSKNLKGTYPGVNLPIEFQNRIVGVIGITGNPLEVLCYSKLIKMTAELMIEQAYVMSELN